MKKVHYLKHVEQIRALMDPLRLRMIKVMGEGATTSRQIADAVGGSVPKIHYHLKDLEKHGLIVVTKHEQKGNLLEKHYRPLSRNFKTVTSLEADMLESKGDTQKDILTRALLVIAQIVEESIVETVNVIESCEDAQMADVARAVMPYGVKGEGATLRLTEKEYIAFHNEYKSLVAKHKKKRKRKSRLAIEVFWMSYPNVETIRELMA